MALNDSSRKMQFSESEKMQQSPQKLQQQQSNNQKETKSSNDKELSLNYERREQESKPSEIEGTIQEQVTVDQKEQNSSEGKANKYHQEIVVKQPNNQDKSFEQTKQIKLERNGNNQLKVEGGGGGGGQATELNKQILLLNYIYDNSLEQIKKMNLKAMQLNYLEEFKHVQLDQTISPLILACYLGRHEIVKHLLSIQNINIDFPSHPIGIPPLSSACMGGFYDVSELLISKGADVHAKNKHGQSPFFFCFSRLQEDSNYFENKRICMKLADLLLANGANIDEIVNEEKGYTILMALCHVQVTLTFRETDSNLSIIRYLLEHGSDCTRTSKKGKDIFQILSKHPNKENIVSLIKKAKDKPTPSDDPLIKDVKLIAQNQKTRYNIPEQEEECRLEGITRQSTTCCSLFSLF